MADSGVRFYPVHLEADSSVVSYTSWFWGWAAVDLALNCAIGSITTTYKKEDHNDTEFTDLVVQMLYCEYMPLGVTLALHAKREAALRGKTLFRSGDATEKGQRACEAAGLAVWARKGTAATTSSLAVDRANMIGRAQLVFAAERLGIHAIPPREERA